MKKVFIIILSLSLVLVIPFWEDSKDIKVTYFKGFIDDKLEKSLFLDSSFVLNYSIEETNIVVAVNVSINEDLLSYISKGVGLVIIPGLKTYNSSLLKNLFNKIEFVKYFFNATTENSLQFEHQEGKDPIVNYITWTSAPRVRERLLLDDPKVKAEALIYGMRMDNGEKETLIWKIQYGKGIILILSAIVGNGYNEDFQFWPYFNYLLYAMMMESAGKTPLRYEDWPYSPVPHERERILLLVIPTIALIISLIVFFLVRGYSRKNPLRKEDLGAFTQMMTEKEGKISEWEDIGFHRQVASLLYLGILGVMATPIAILWGALLYKMLIKYPMVQGMLDWTINLFNALWFAFDFGTSYALVKYLSEYRVKKPEEGIKYVQFFVWWQFITGIIQVFLVTNISARYVVHLDIAYMSWVFITYSLIQYPGIFMVAIFVFRGLQRFDLEQLFNILYTIGFSMIFPAIIAYYYREEIATNIIFGDMLNTVIGFMLGLYIGNWMFLITTIVVMKKLKIPLKAIFRIDFDWNVIKKALSFGGKSMIGDTVVAAVYSIQVLLVARYIINYQEWQGFYSVAMSLSWIVAWITAFTASVLPAVSEAYSRGFKKLTQVYIAESFRYGYVIITWLVLWIILIRDKIVLGFLGPAWRPVINLLLLAMIFQYLGPPAWINDVAQLGAERPGLRAIFTALEQFLRLILLYVFLAILNLQMYGVFYAYIIALFVKDITTTLATHLKIVRVKILWWRTFISSILGFIIIAIPLLALINFFWGLFYGKTVIILGSTFSGNLIAGGISVIIAFSSILIYLPVLVFLGSWNEVTFKDFKKALNLLGLMRVALLPALKLMEVLAKVSPLFKKVPQLYYEGLEEAKELMKIKKEILIT